MPKTIKRKAFYILSTMNKAKKNIYKIGVHTGDIYSLLSRYLTYILDPIIYYFQYLDKESDNVEDILKRQMGTSIFIFIYFALRNI